MGKNMMNQEKEKGCSTAVSKGFRIIQTIFHSHMELLPIIIIFSSERRGWAYMTTS